MKYITWIFIQFLWRYISLDEPVHEQKYNKMNKNMSISVEMISMYTFIQIGYQRKFSRTCLSMRCVQLPGSYFACKFDYTCLDFSDSNNMNILSKEVVYIDAF